MRTSVVEASLLASGSDASVPASPPIGVALQAASTHASASPRSAPPWRAARCEGTPTGDHTTSSGSTPLSGSVVPSTLRTDSIPNVSLVMPIARISVT
jgi:hypothetical protein